MDDDNDNDKNKNKNKKDYEVGYGKPPKRTRFGQPGGNPQNKKGRPPGRNIMEYSRLSEEALTQIVLDSAQKPVSIQEDGQELTVPLYAASIKRMARDAAHGDPVARKLYFSMVHKAAKGQDKIILDEAMSMADIRDNLFKANQKPGSLECFNAFYAWFMVKKQLRVVEGDDSLLYEHGEPVTHEDWVLFSQKHDFLKQNPRDVLQWPVKYSYELEEERLENMTRAERAQEHLKEFRHRKEMREKEGRTKWKFLVEEPVDETDWINFEQHIQDIMDGKENPAPWPPAYWDEEPEE